MNIKTHLIYSGYDIPFYKKLNPTGRWKLVSENGDISMLIEGRGWVFNYWIQEEDIEFVSVGESPIFDCRTLT